jgi:hypothetical protein
VADELIDTPFRDQRVMVGVERVEDAHGSPEDVERAWAEWARVHGLPSRRRLGDHSVDLRRSRKKLYAGIEGGKWITACPECNGGVPCWPFHRKGCCLDCGTIYAIDYPTIEEVARISELLRGRPVAQQNYMPHRGDTVESLAVENDVYQFTRPEHVGVHVPTLEATLSPATLAELREKGVLPV